MVQPHAVLEVAYRIVDFGVTAMIGLQFQRVPVLVGDEAVIAVGGEERQLSLSQKWKLRIGGADRSQRVR